MASELREHAMMLDKDELVDNIVFMEMDRIRLKEENTKLKEKNTKLKEKKGKLKEKNKKLKDLKQEYEATSDLLIFYKNEKVKKLQDELLYYQMYVYSVDASADCPPQKEDVDSFTDDPQQRKTLYERIGYESDDDSDFQIIMDE